MFLDFRRTLVLLPAMLLGAPLAHAADPQPYGVEFVSTEDDSIDSTLKATSQLQSLRASAPVNPFGLIARARSDVDRLKTVLESFGYYQGSVSITINAAALDDPKLGDLLSALPTDTLAQCKVTPQLGPRYRIGRIDIDGEIPEGARETMQLASGAPAVASDVLAAGARLLTKLEDRGYAFAKVDPPVAYEEPEARVLDVKFHVVTGPRVNVGEIRIRGLQRVHESRVRARLLLHTGEPYSALKVEQARKDLLGMGVFSTVNVRLGNRADSEGRVQVTFQVRERPRRAVSLSAGFSSDLGGSGGVTWANRNAFGNAEQVSLAATIINLGGSATKSVGYDTSAKLLLPDVGHRDQSLQFAVGAVKQSLQAYDQTAVTAGVTLRRKLSSIWSASIGVTAAHETVTQQSPDCQPLAAGLVPPAGTSCTCPPPQLGTCDFPDVTRVYTLLALPLTVSYDSTDLRSPLDDPLHGMRLSLSLTPTLSFGRPSSTFIVTQASVAKYFDLHGLIGSDPGRSMLALRALAGVAAGATVFTLPPDQRFYAGGSGTIRGYRYQSVGDQLHNGSALGGTAISAASAEFRQRFGANFGAAFFVDAGQVTQTQSLSPVSGVFRVGVGAGVRYYTPIGPLRFDIALPTNKQPTDDHFEVYIGLGQAF